MHAPAAAAGAAGRPPKELGGQLTRRQSFCQGVAVSAMRAEDDIVGLQMGANPGGDGLLAHVGVAGPVNQAPLVAAGQLLFALPDGLHRAIQAEQRLFGSADFDRAGHGLRLTRHSANALATAR